MISYGWNESAELALMNGIAHQPGGDMAVADSVEALLPSTRSNVDSAVSLERLKRNSQFGANRTVVFCDAERGRGRDPV